MKKYLEELRLVTWPKKKEVISNFWIVFLGIAFFTIYFILSDTMISNILNKIYS